MKEFLRSASTVFDEVMVGCNIEGLYFLAHYVYICHIRARYVRKVARGVKITVRPTLKTYSVLHT